MKTADKDTEQWRKEERVRLREELIDIRSQVYNIGEDPDEVIEEVKRIEHERDVDHARMSLNAALREFKSAAVTLARAYENDLIDPSALSETWPEWMPSIEEVAADVEGIEPLEEMPK